LKHKELIFLGSLCKFRLITDVVRAAGMVMISCRFA